MAPLAHSMTKALKLGHNPTKNIVARERNQATGYRQRKGKFEIYKHGNSKSRNAISKVHEKSSVSTATFVGAGAARASHRAKSLQDSASTEVGTFIKQSSISINSFI